MTVWAVSPAPAAICSTLSTESCRSASNKLITRDATTLSRFARSMSPRLGPNEVPSASPAFRLL
eukprot:8132082-Pyramimonas_sp.AAC.1